MCSVAATTQPSALTSLDEVSATPPVIATSSQGPPADGEPPASCRSSSSDQSQTCNQTPTAQSDTRPSTSSSCSLEDLLPFPKAGARKTKHPVKRRKTRILTDTPVRNELKEQQTKKQVKNRGTNRPTAGKSCKRKLTMTESTVEPGEKAKRSKKKKRRTLPVDTDVSDTESELQQPAVDPDGNANGLDASSAHVQQGLVEPSDSADDVDLNRSTDDSDSNEVVKCNNLKQGDYVLVQLKGLKNVFHYVAQIKEPISGKNDAKITYLTKLPSKFSGSVPQFVLPASVETFDIPCHDIVRKLPHPTQAGGTKRMSNRIIFHMSFDGYNLANA